MSFPVKINRVLQTQIPPNIQDAGVYDFSKKEYRIFPVDQTIDLIDSDRNAIAKIKVMKVTWEKEHTAGKFKVVRLYNAQEKKQVSAYWKQHD